MQATQLQHGEEPRERPRPARAEEVLPLGAQAHAPSRDALARLFAVRRRHRPQFGRRLHVADVLRADPSVADRRHDRVQLRVHAELHQDVLDVRPQRVPADLELGRDLIGRFAVGEQLQDLELTARQPVEPLIDVVVARPEPAEPAERELHLVVRVQRLSAVSGSDGLGQVLDGGRLAQEPVGPRLDRPAERQLVVGAGEDDHGGLLRHGADPAGRLQPVDPRHLEVDQDHVGLSGLGLVGGALAVHRDHDHIEVVFLVEGHGERLTERSVVVDDDDGDAGFVGIHRVES